MSTAYKALIPQFSFAKAEKIASWNISAWKMFFCFVMISKVFGICWTENIYKKRSRIFYVCCLSRDKKVALIITPAERLPGNPSQQLSITS